jgi:3-oxoacyl-(acyl-carrier-protein) synthase
MTAPNPEAVRRCIRLALDDAGIGPAQVGAINGHLTATSADPKEVASWAAALEASPGRLPPITSTKSMIGHTLGAAGAIESIVSVMTIREGCIPPTINLTDPDPEAQGLTIVANEAARHDVRVVLSNSFGFGGQNTALIFQRWDG